MSVRSQAGMAKYFSFFFCGCAALLFLIAISETPFSIGVVVLAALFICYVLILPVKHKKRLLHTMLALIFFAITIDVALLLIELPDLLSKFAMGFALFTLCLSYGTNVGEELQSLLGHQDYEIDYQSLIYDVRSNRELMHVVFHETTNELLTQVCREESAKLFGYGKANSLANIHRELLSQAVSDIVADGYAIKILELQQSDTQLTKPVMTGIGIMLPLWRKYTLKQAKKPSSDFLKKAIRQLARHRVRLEQRKASLAHVLALNRMSLTGSEPALLKLGYKIAEFENHYRGKAGIHEIERIETSIEREFFELMDMCKKLPLALDGNQARALLLAPGKFRFDSRQIHLACTNTDADTVVAALEKNGVATKTIYKDGTAIRRYQLTSEAFTAIEPYIEVYVKDEETGLYSAADMSSDHQFAGFVDFYHISLKGHKIKTVPPSFFIQQILYCWADFPEAKEIAWVEDYDILSKKYYPHMPIQQDPVFSYAFNYSKTKSKESAFTYSP